MQMSETIDQLAAAMSKAQATVSFPELDSHNPAYKHNGKTMRYPSLRSVIEAYRPALTANGLSLVQTFEPSVDPAVILVTTVLMHATGQWMSGTASFPVERPGPQGYASASTYARRYSLMAMVGLAPDDDDDANAAQGQRQIDSRGDERAQQAPPARPAPPPAHGEREALIKEVLGLHKQVHPDERFPDFADRFMKRAIGGLGDLDLADLKDMRRHLKTEAAVAHNAGQGMPGLEPPSAETSALRQGA